MTKRLTESRANKIAALIDTVHRILVIGTVLILYDGSEAERREYQDKVLALLEIIR